LANDLRIPSCGLPQESANPSGALGTSLVERDST